MPFLGVVITRIGMISDKEKTAAIDKLDYPTNLKEVRSEIGMFVYSRRFIAKFREIAAPLYEQTKKSMRNPAQCKRHCSIEGIESIIRFPQKGYHT